MKTNKAKKLPLRYILSHFAVIDDVLYRLDHHGRIKSSEPLLSAPHSRRADVSIKGVSYLRSRVVWALTNKADPGELVVDHRFGETWDDRPSKLRACTPAENSANKHERPTSPVPGVSYAAGRGAKCWGAKLKHLHLGYFETAEMAANAKRVAEELIALGWSLPPR